MANVFNTLTQEQKATYALQFVILDAIEKGHTCVNEMTEYMTTKICMDAVMRYMDLMESK
jgi:hypothetical protein